MLILKLHLRRKNKNKNWICREMAIFLGTFVHKSSSIRLLPFKVVFVLNSLQFAMKQNHFDDIKLHRLEWNNDKEITNCLTFDWWQFRMCVYTSARSRPPFISFDLLKRFSGPMSRGHKFTICHNNNNLDSYDVTKSV